jgi:hypothetical protein
MLALILGIALGAGMYWFREGSVGPRRALKRVDLLAHVFSLVAVIAALIPLSSLTAEFLLKIALHDKYTELGEKLLIMYDRSTLFAGPSTPRISSKRAKTCLRS